MFVPINKIKNPAKAYGYTITYFFPFLFDLFENIIAKDCENKQTLEGFLKSKRRVCKGLKDVCWGW